MKSKIYKLILHSSLVVVPLLSTSAIVSCSKNNQLQDEANKIYLKLYKAFNSENVYAKETSNVYNIFDEESLKNNLKSENPFTELIDENKFTFRISNLEYKPKEGILSFRFDLVNKSNNQAIQPNLDTTDEYYSQIIEIKGFNKLDNSQIEEINNIFDQINNINLELTKSGAEWIDKNFDNLKDNIVFNNPNEPNYFLNYIEPISSIQSDNFIVSDEIIVDKFNQEPIEYKSNQTVVFNFWLLIKFKTGNNENPMTINLSIRSDNKQTNEVKSVQFSKS